MMRFRPDILLGHDFGETRQAYQPRDAIIYALGLGLGRSPVDDADLAFLDETRLSVVPSFAVTLCSPGMWIRDPAFGVDFAKLVHSAQDARFHAPLPPATEVVGTARVLTVRDRGEGRGAVVEIEREIRDAGDGELYCTLVQTLLLRGNGGFGGEPAPRASAAVPATPHSQRAFVKLSGRAALIYRLSGDWNPLHIDPLFARKAGFERPIMHGLGTYATAGIAVSRALGRNPSDMSRLACRFSGIVMPGDLLVLSIREDGSRAQFQAQVGDRIVLDGGEIEWKSSL